MKIAITGASGFIGRHVLRKLAYHPVDIVCMTRDASRLSDLEMNYRIVEMDINHVRIDNYDTLGRPEVLIHLAWNGLPNYKALHHFETELPVQYRFLKNLIEAGLPSLVVTGTCFEYGMQSGQLSEKMFTLPSNPYGYAKDALRKQIEYLGTVRQFKLTWARLFYMYGDGQPQTSLYSKLKEAVARGDKTFDMSGGEQLRDFLIVDDIAGYIVKLALTEEHLGIVNICSGIPISIRSLVERWIKENDWSIKLNYGVFPYPDYEPMAFWGDDSKLLSVLK